MLEIELDIFSGRPNPTWKLSEEEEKELLDIITSDPTQVSPVYSPEEVLGLGYRGLIVREIKTEKSIWHKTISEFEHHIPDEFRVGSKPDKQAAAEFLLRTSEKREIRVNDVLREEASKGVILVPSHPKNVDVDLDTDGEVLRAPLFDVCHSNFFIDNSSTFNQPHEVRRNNCYSFAANHLGSGRHALPGLQGGRPAREGTCGDVVGGLYADGWTHHNCWPSASNVLVIALAVKPGGPLDWDYHFYRLVGGPNENWTWAHKQGGTPARNTDDCGMIIRNANTPKHCCKEYRDFCGFFYANGPTVTVKCQTRCYP